MEQAVIIIKVERKNGLINRQVTVREDDSEGKIIIDDTITEDALNIQDTKLNIFQRWVEKELRKTEVGNGKQEEGN